ncbi:Lrp/AsnC family transcriptional regulator [Prauserella halophila]|uniref:Lrp/AsnC family transcriptional regulator n=1 Tax=Prauserella halophila TaxID=185641 RepID=A0ABP4GEX8_9PSEU|nr:Lrp/AsnC family transcriptional regulator [Prauserella halophila]MCP2234647.1 DNA-binding transcriptional regulator, Lrp family [Prauserella halophila]
MSKNAELDSVDVRILAALQNDSRIPNKDLAAAVGIAPSTCLDRVNRLREAGVILGYSVRVDAEKIGRPLQALLYIRVQPHRRPLVDPFVQHVLALPETQELYHVSGPDDFLVHVAAENPHDLQRLVLDEFTDRPEVALVHTNLVFERWDAGPLLPPE